MSRPRLALSVLALVNLAAGDEALPLRPVEFAEKGAFVTMTVGLPDLVDDALRRKLRSGIASNIVLRAFLYHEGESKPLGLTVRTYRIWYDVWDEVYFLQIQDPLGQLKLKYKTEAEAVAQLVRLSQFPLAPVGSIPIGVRFFVAVLIEINPISPELLAQARRWLTRPGGVQKPPVSDPFFSLFGNTKISAVEREIRFRSTPFERRPPPPPPAAPPPPAPPKDRQP
jgi:hypothetical protein